MQAEQAAIFFNSTCMMMVAPHLQYAPHRHVVLQLTFALDEQPFEVWTEQGGWQQTHAVAINSNVDHGLRNYSGWQVTFCLLAESTPGSMLRKKILGDADIVHLDHGIFTTILPELNALRLQPGTGDSGMMTMVNTVFRQVCGPYAFGNTMDERIAQVIAYIRANLHASFSAAELAQQVFLSEDRFLHLFKAQTGSPLRQYILWQRMGLAFRLFMEGKSLKEAAYEAGFSDPAHFSRSFAQVYGIAPSAYAGLKQHYRFYFQFP